MNKAKWIWYYGEFEIYHSLLVHMRRHDYMAAYPPFWNMPAPYPNVNFKKEFWSETAFTFKAAATGAGSIVLDGIRYPLQNEITVGPGQHKIKVQIMCQNGFPCLYIDSAWLVTDETWEADHAAGKSTAVGCEPEFTDPERDPLTFPFEYSPLDTPSPEKTDGGYIFDFGKECFGPVFVRAADGSVLNVRYGESREEALSPQGAVLRFNLPAGEGTEIPSSAFRYIFTDKEAEITARREYLPLPQRGAFTCSDSRINEILEVCKYTFQLNSREFYLDGIKRDRWVWGGDAYQSYPAGACIYGDESITRRTLLALLGKPPVEQHINTIADYSLLTIIAVHEYYMRTGDRDFVDRIKDRVLELSDFIYKRLDHDSGTHYLVQRDDWIFIDWAEIDKDGPIAAEQILLWQAFKCVKELYGVEYLDLDGLKSRILRDFWDDEKGAFIDCAASGRRHVTRHANIFAILYDFGDDDIKNSIVINVLENPQIAHITTPYFKFFELCALCMCGRTGEAVEIISSYWGGMLDLGATTIWEEFDPTLSGAQHYAMYGLEFNKSLCHAWGAGPVYILMRYGLGVKPLTPGYGQYEVKPDADLFESFSGTFPLPGGRCVKIECRDGKASWHEESD